MQKNLTIMFVDDSDSDLKLFQDAVKVIDESIECIMVETGYAAVSYLTLPLGPLPDFIFLDINMHGMNGLECLHKIKTHQPTAHIPVIMFTTARVDSYQDTAKLLGAKQCFSKSVNFDENVGIIASVIGEQLKMEMTNE